MFGALAYNQNKVDSEEAKVLFSNRMLLSEDGNFSIGECMRSFEIQMPVQLSTRKPILHISINPHPEDVLTDQQLSDIAKEYMRKLGYGDQPYLVYKHTKPAFSCALPHPPHRAERQMGTKATPGV